MKGLKISLVLILSVLIVNIFFHIYVCCSTGEVCGLIDMAYESAMKNDDDKLSELTRKINNKIMKNIPLWQTGINHGEVDSVSTSLEKLNGSITSDGEEHISVYLRELRFYVDNLWQRERLTVFNIF